MSAGLFELLTGSSTPLLASGDVVCFVDVSDTTQAAQGSLVKATQTQFFAALNVPVVVTSASAGAFAVGLSGTTNSAFKVDASTALQVAGLTVTGAVTGGTVAVVVTDSGAAANFTLNAKGTGTIGIGSVSTGRVTITPVTTITGALTLSAALTYGGVTLSNAVTGTGNMVLSAGPTFTGTITAAIANFSGLVTGSGGVKINGGSFAAGVMFKSATGGFSLTGITGSSFDFSLTDPAGNDVMDMITGTQNIKFFGGVGINAAPSSAGTLTTSNRITVNAGGLVVTGNSSIVGSLDSLTSLSGSGAVSGFTTANFSSTVTVTSNSADLVVNGSSGATSNVERLLFQRGGVNKWRLGVNMEGGNVDVFGLFSDAAGLYAITAAATTGNVFFGASATVTSGFTVSAGTTAVQALTATTGVFVGQVNVTTAMLRLDNAQSLRGLNAGVSTTYQLIGVTAGDAVSIDADGRGATFGSSVTASFLRSTGSNYPSTGYVRVQNNVVGIAWMNAAASGDVTLKVDASNIFAFSSGISCTTVTASGNMTTTAALAVAATQKFYLDGVAATGDTYIHESSANNMRFVSEGVTYADYSKIGGVATAKFSVYLQALGSINIGPTSTPTGGGITNTPGDLAWDTSFLYVATAANTWKRIALTAF